MFTAGDAGKLVAMTRLFVAIAPPAEIVARLVALPRPPVAGLNWARPEQLVAKLRPLGHVPTELVAPLVEALDAGLDGAPAVRCRLGPTTRRPRGNWGVVVSVAGLDELATAVFEATEPVVPVTHPQPFEGMLVLARGRTPAELAGDPVNEAWTAREVRLVADRSSPRGPRLEPLAGFALRREP